MFARFFKRHVGGMLVRNTVVSTGVFLAGLGILWLLVEGAGGNAVLATALSFLIANSISMLLTSQLSRVWAFRHREATGFLGGAPLFFAISTASLVIPVICLWGSRNVLMLDSALADNVAANVVGLFLGFLTRFALFRMWVFKRAEPRDRSTGDRAPRPSPAAPGD